MIEDYLDFKNEELKFKDDEQERIFYTTLYAVVNDHLWCHQHGIDYVDPDFKLASRRLYDELFSKRDDTAQLQN